MTAPTIDADLLRAAINAVRRAMSSDATRPHLSCLRLDVTPTQITTAATDGTWIARYTHDGDFGGKASLTLTADGARALVKWLRPRREKEAGCDICGATVAYRRSRGPCEIDKKRRVVERADGRFAVTTADGNLVLPDLDRATPPETDAPFAGLISTRLLRRISRSFESAYSATAALQFRGDDVLGPVRITSPIMEHACPERRLLVVCMPVRGPS